MQQPTDTSRVTPPSDGLLPPHIRRRVLTTVAILSLGAVYLVAVRGEVLLQDLAAIAAYCF
jgi:hypothetical protein